MGLFTCTIIVSSSTGLSFDAHIRNITKKCLFFPPYHFRMIAGVMPFLLQVDPFIASRVDCCNALFSDLAKEVLKNKMANHPKCSVAFVSFRTLSQESALGFFTALIPLAAEQYI